MLGASFIDEDSYQACQQPNGQGFQTDAGSNHRHEKKDWNAAPTGCDRAVLRVEKSGKRFNSSVSRFGRPWAGPVSWSADFTVSIGPTHSGTWTGASTSRWIPRDSQTFFACALAMEEEERIIRGVFGISHVRFVGEKDNGKGKVSVFPM
jgi:hypothetical protein